MAREEMIEEIVFTRSPIERQIDMYGCEIGISRQWYEETCCILEDINKGIYRKIPDGAVVLTREEYERLKSDRKIKVVQHLDDEYTVEIPQCEYDEMLEQARKETAREICDFAENEIKKLGKETTTDSFGERPLLFYEAAGKLIRSIREKFEVE